MHSDELLAGDRAVFLEYTRALRHHDEAGAAQIVLLLGVAGVMRDFRFRLALLIMGTIVLILSAADIGRLAPRDVHFSCEKFLSNVEGGC